MLLRQVTFQAQPQILHAGNRFKSKLAVDDNRWHRHGASYRFRQLGMPNGSLEGFGDYQLRPNRITVIGHHGFDHTGHVLARDSMGAFVKHFQMYFF